jgi:cellulose synthase/poly-beta-1,6-N-acetylglucosamine synthase-like glycosyltransferase
MDHPGKVLMAFPSTGHDISTRFMRSFTELDVYDRERAVQIWEAIGAPDDVTPIDLRVLHNYVACESTNNIAKARNRLADEFLTQHTDCDWLWFCDTDMVFPPDALHRLLARAVQQDVRILGGLCIITTAEGPLPTLFAPSDETVTQVLLDWPDDSVVEVAATGTGFLLIHREVLEKLQADADGSKNAWFGFDIVKSKSGKEYALGEDVSFCLRAQAAGYTVHVDTTNHVGHHKGVKVWWPESTRTEPAVIPPEMQGRAEQENLHA